VVREGKNTGERLVLLVTSPAQIPTESFVAAVRSAYPATTVLWGVNGKVSDTAITDKTGTLYGPGYIGEMLRVDGRDLHYRISPQAFFQTNTKGAERLYGLIADWIGRPKAALDLFCGGGGIALSLAGSCGKVYGAELNASAVADAKANAALNGIANVDFYSGEVQTLLPSMLALGCEVAVVDPPRAGLHPSALPPLLEKGPARLIYVSCNPEALARDLGKLMPAYRVVRCELVDLFPQTEHVETLVELART
jgi:23S rRNA (uracil1939-C5)-methyltransferase